MYAGFWKRFLAFFLDNLIVNTIASVIVQISMAGLLKEDISSSAVIMGIVFASLFSWAIYLLYWAIFESSSLQATPGKMALGIKVTDMNGERLTFARAFGRNLAKFVSGLTLNVGYVMAGYTVRRQALHDKMANCLVVSKKATAEDLTPLPKASGGKIFLAILGGLAPIIISALIMALLAFVVFGGIMSGMGGSLKGLSKADYTAALSNVEKMEGYLEDIADAQESYFQANGAYASNLTQLEAAVPSLTTESYNGTAEYQLGFNNDYVTAHTAGQEGSPEHTIVRCYKKDMSCIESEDFGFVFRTEIPYSSQRICCL